MKKRIRVLIVDDSDFTRQFITNILSEDPEIKIAGEASNGAEAISKAGQLKPDIVTMDVVMPVMDGLEAIEKIMETNPMPILVVTSKSDVDTAYEAISRGALEVMEKPDLDDQSVAQFIRKVKFLSKFRVFQHIREPRIQDAGRLEHSILNRETRLMVEPPDENAMLKTIRGLKKIVAIASSTGGPKALSILLSSLPADFPAPIVIAQHIPVDFVSGLVNWLDSTVRLKVKSGEAGELIKGGTVYISSPERHMKIDRSGRIAFEERGLSDIYFPSCNVLLSSAAETYGMKSLGVILTGMGDDGVLGIGRIRKAGGFTIAQDESTSVVYGMPGAAVESGFVDQVLPIENIAERLISLVIPPAPAMSRHL